MSSNSRLSASTNGCTAGATILNSVGLTPLLELSRFAQAVRLPAGTRLFAKAEQLNPGGSCKDRLALALIGEAERHGLRPGGTIVEATSGNTGISLAMAAAIRGYHLHVVSSTKVSQEKLRALRTSRRPAGRRPSTISSAA